MDMNTSVFNRLGLLLGLAGLTLAACQPQPTASTAQGSAAAATSAPANAAETDDLYRGLEFAMPRVQEPRIPSHRVSITDFGAVGDGLTKNTRAFEQAIAAAAAKGG